MSTANPTAKFGNSRAAEYETQSRIALASYDACHELSACLLSASLGSEARHILVTGAGATGQEFLMMGKLEPRWSFVAVDPSVPVLKQSIGRVEQAGLSIVSSGSTGRWNHFLRLESSTPQHSPASCTTFRAMTEG